MRRGGEMGTWSGAGSSPVNSFLHARRPVNMRWSATQIVTQKSPMRWHMNSNLNENQPTRRWLNITSRTTAVTFTAPLMEEADLLKCWHGSAPAAPTAASAHGRVVNAISAALRRGPRLSKQGVLRGC